MANKVVEAALQRVRSIAYGLRVTGAVISGRGYTTYANELNDAADRIEAACSAPPVQSRHPNSPVPEIYIDFTDGTIDGNCSNCTPAEVADALARIVAELQMMDDTSSYLNFRGGVVFKGTRFPEGYCR